MTKFLSTCLTSMGRFLVICSIFLATFATTSLCAQEETEFSWPLGPIGGKFRIWTDDAFIRVTEITPGAPGAVGGLQVGDFINGAFGRKFDPISQSKFDGPVRQLGAAIDHAELNNIPLPLSIIRPGTGNLTVTIVLPASDGLSGAYTRTSTRFDSIYEAACAALHARIMADSDGDVGYPTGFMGLGLLGHPNWNDTTGPKPYRLSINKIRDRAVARISAALLTPVEAKHFDGTANPNYVDTGLENWELGLAVMFISEYVSKTGEFTTYQTTVQRGAVLMANRIQNWAQPNNGGTADRSYTTSVGATGHGGVVGDYTHQWYVGINIVGVHLFNGLAMAKRAGADMAERPKDGHYFGYPLNPGDAIPATISPALPATITLPRGAQDTRVLPHIDNVTNAPLTTINTVNAFESPWFYDCSLDQKFWLHWDCLRRSTGTAGNVGYAAVTGGAGDAGGRTPGSAVGMKIYLNGTTLDPADQVVLDRQMNYIVAAHDIHLNSHAYNMGGACFTAMVMPYMNDRDQRYFLENSRFFYNLSQQPDGSIRYFRGRDFGDPYMGELDAMHADIAMAGSVARGGLPHIPGFETNRIMARVRQPLLQWPTKEARALKLDAGVTTTSFDLDLLDGNGAVVNPASVTATWSVVSGPVTTGIFATPSAIDTAASFPQAGTYRLRMDATSGPLTTYELIDVYVPSSPIPGYVMGEAEYNVYTGITGTTVASLTADAKFPAAPDIVSTLTQLQGTHSGSNYGSTITCVVIPPVTGDYRFYIASDDDSQLRFNTSGAPPTTTVIASVSGYTDVGQWNKYTSQQSAIVTLTAGQPYYLQALHKEGSGGDHLAVGWITPENSTISVIGQVHIARPLVEESPSLVTHPVSVTTTLGAPVTFNFNVTGPEPRFFQWRRNGVNFGAAQATAALNFTSAGAGLAGTWDCVYTSAGTVLTTNSATLTFTDTGILTMGGLWKEYYSGISGNTIAELTSHPDYLINTTSSGVLEQPYTGDQGDNYGQRWSGWIIPTETASYRFLATGDDSFQLFLSPDQYESHKHSIIYSPTWRSEMVWSGAVSSAYIPLVAGQRYYVEFLHKDSSGADQAAFTWQKQGDPTPASGATSLIPSANLQYATGGTRPDAATAPPYAGPDTFYAETGATVEFDALANDVDANLATVTISSVTQPANGSLSIRADGKRLIYTSGTAAVTTTATYTITNALGHTATASITINVRDLAAGMLAHWRMDEVSGTKLQDAVAGNHATLTGGMRQAGHDGNAVLFNGTSDKATAPAAAVSGLTDQITVAFWSFGGAATANTSVIYAKDASNNRAINIHLPFGSTVYWDAGNAAGGFDRISKSASAAELTSGWTHWAFTKNATTGEMKIFRNGTVWQSGTAKTKMFSSISSLTLGWDGSSNYYNGSLDDIRIYNTALNATDIALLASAQSQRLLLLGNEFTVPENVSPGTIIGTIAGFTTLPATTASHAITSGNGAGQFSIDPATGNVSVVSPLNFETASNHLLTITATDNASPARTNSALANIIVTNSNEAPTFTTTPLTRADGAMSLPYTATLAGFASDVDAGDVLTYSKTAGPAWLNVASNGALTGTPDAAGSAVFTVRVTDAGGLFAETTLTLTIAESTLYTGVGGWWRMNEGTGTTTADSSGAGRTATLTASPLWTTGKLGGGIQVNGTSQYLTIAGATTPSPLTISAWIKLTATSGIQTILSQQSAFSFRSNGTGLRFTTLGIKDYDIGSQLTANAWQHVAVTFTPNVTGGMKLYVNGVLKSTQTSTGINSNSNAWQIGRTNTGEYFNGVLDEVRLYTRVLTDAEISGIYGASTPFEDWRASKFTLSELGNSAISGPDAMTVHSLDVLGAYAFGLDPKGGPSPAVTRVAGGTTPYFEYRRRKAPHGLIFAEKVSSDLGTWSGLGLIQISVTDDGNNLTETVRLSPSDPNAKRLFFRAEYLLAP